MSGLLGTVLSVQANYYWVRLDPGYEQYSGETLAAVSANFPSDPWPVSVLLCTRRARLRKIGQQVMVGDRVLVEEPDWTGQRGAIAQVFPRLTELRRPPVANANHILLVFALEEPALDPYQLSRFLVTAESTGLGITLCLNKSDLVSAKQQSHWCSFPLEILRKRLRQWGYEPILISLYTGDGLAVLAAQLSQKLTVISGPSGVGKSSLINKLVPTVDLRVGSVSGKLGRGRHTTRHVELFELPIGGLLADTPGFNQPVFNFPPESLANYFPEARQRLADGTCQFSNCLHRDEPNCIVRGNWERYEHYLSFLDEAIAQQVEANQLSDPESTIKLKTKGKGQLQYEPKLETKKYRRPSRRTQQQALQEFYQDTEDLMPEDNFMN
jgi:ribosome biogenesis GTPase